MSFVGGIVYNRSSDRWEGYWASRDEIIDRDYRLYMSDHPNRRYAEVFSERVKIEGNLVLDIGTGAGFWLAWMRERGAERVVGIDVSPSSLQIARSNVGESGWLVAGDTRDLPFPDNCFDFVYSFGVIEHFIETRQAIREHLRVAKSGGKVAISVPNEYSHRHLVKYLRMPQYAGQMHKHYTPSEFYNMCLEEGMTNVEIHGIDIRLMRANPQMTFMDKVWGRFLRDLNRVLFYIENRYRWIQFFANLHLCIGEKPVGGRMR